MALQVWLPLNGNLENYGLDSSKKLTSSSAIYSNGKIGKCLDIDHYAIYSGAFQSLEKITSYSFAAWMYIDSSKEFVNYADILQLYHWSDSLTDNVIRIEHSDTAGRFQIIYPKDAEYGENTKRYYSIGNSDLAKNQWCHIAVTNDGTTINTYLNGKLTIETPVSNIYNIGCLTGKIALGTTSTAAKLNDVRIYDHVLSSLEVKYLSQALVLHYPLNDPYPTASINKYGGEYFNGKYLQKQQLFTATQLTDERGYNYQLSYIGTGNNTWCYVWFPRISHTPNRKYKFSCKIRIHSILNVTAFYLRAARINNDWGITNINILSIDGIDDEEWHEVYIIEEMPETYTRSDVTYNVTPLVEFFTNNLSTEGVEYSMNFDLKDIQISECESDIIATNGSWSDNIVYDLSGYGNNGQTVLSSYPWAEANSPRYNCCYKFKGGQQIQKIKNPISSATENFSISFWAKREVVGTQGIYTARSTIGSGIGIFFIDIHIRFDDGIVGEFTDYDIPLNEWIHICLTRDIVSKKLYINGELKQTLSSGDLSNIYEYGTIGASSTGTGIGDNNRFSGYLSDFRIYNTTLSEEDVKRLYQIPVSLTSTGVLSTQSEVIE